MAAMTDQERREATARQEVAAAACSHAADLPASSELRSSLAYLAVRLDPTNDEARKIAGERVPA